MLQIIVNEYLTSFGLVGGY